MWKLVSCIAKSRGASSFIVRITPKAYINMKGIKTTIRSENENADQESKTWWSRENIFLFNLPTPNSHPKFRMFVCYSFRSCHTTEYLFRLGCHTYHHHWVQLIIHRRLGGTYCTRSSSHIAWNNDKIEISSTASSLFSTWKQEWQ